MLGKILIAAAILSGVALAMILNMTTPANAGAFGILAVFLFAYVFVLSVLTFLIYGTFRLVAYVMGVFVVRRPVVGMSLSRAYYYATVLAIVPVIIISMQSVGAVGPYELLLIGLLVLIGCIYVTKRTS